MAPLCSGDAWVCCSSVRPWRHGTTGKGSAVDATPKHIENGLPKLVSLSSGTVPEPGILSCFEILLHLFECMKPTPHQSCSKDYFSQQSSRGSPHPHTWCCDRKSPHPDPEWTESRCTALELTRPHRLVRSRAWSRIPRKRSPAEAGKAELNRDPNWERTTSASACCSGGLKQIICRAQPFTSMEVHTDSFNASANKVHGSAAPQR